MKVQLFSPPWGTPALTSEAGKAIDILDGNLWEDTVETYLTDCATKEAADKRRLKGMQTTMNQLLKERFTAYGWDAHAGHFRKGDTWVRVTFRHQMSLGSDILEAMKVCALKGVELAMIVVGDRDMLNRLAPGQGNSMVSFEGVKHEVETLNGVIDIPLIVGGLVLTPHERAKQG